MKKLVFIMISLSFIAIGCSEKRVMYKELSQDGGIVYFDGKPFTGIAFSMWDEKHLKEEAEITNGKLDGVYKEYHENGQLKKEIVYKNGIVDGVGKEYLEDGQLVEDYLKAQMEKEFDFAVVNSDFEEVKAAYDELSSDNKQLHSELDSKKEDLEDLGIQLEKYKGDASMVKKLKRELETFRGLIKSYLHQIDSLK